MSMPDLAPLHQALPDGFPAQMQELAEWLFVQLRAETLPALAALSADELAAIALRQVERLSDAMGGSSVYLHKGISYRLTPRNREMCAKFRGDYRILAREYKLSEQQVRNIVDRYQRERFLAQQSDMFGA